MQQQQPENFQTDLPVGEILRRTRSHYGQSLVDIERALRIRAVQLEALENGNYSALPGRVYVIGFIRSYSEYLGLDGDKMVELYKRQSGTKGASPAALNFPVDASDSKMPQFWQVGVSAVAVIVILTVWFSMPGGDRKMVSEIPPIEKKQVQAEVQPGVETAVSGEPAQPQESGPPQPAPVQNTADADAKPTADTPMPTSAPAPVAGTAPAAGEAEASAQIPISDAAKQKGIILKIKKNSWVEIREKDGKSIVSRVLNAGDQYYVPDRPDLTISLGNAGGVELQVEGKSLKPLGADGEVRRNIPLDTAFLKKNYAL